jgi:hypothetical protein
LSFVVVWILLGLAAVVLLVIAAVVNVWSREPTLNRDGD